MEAKNWCSVVFIDLDRTILEGPFEPVIFPLILGEIGQQAGLDTPALREAARQENWRRQCDPACSAVHTMDWDDIFAGLASRYGARLSTNAAEAVRQYAGPPYAQLYPGARQALEHLAAHPQRALVAATKGLARYQIPVLDGLGLTSLFTDILTPEGSQALKQELAFYGNWPACTAMQIMVGDLYEDDVLPAHAFGFRTVWRRHAGDPPVDTSCLPVQPDAMIYSLEALPDTIKRLENGVCSA